MTETTLSSFMATTGRSTRGANAEVRRVACAAAPVTRAATRRVATDRRSVTEFRRDVRPARFPSCDNGIAVSRARLPADSVDRERTSGARIEAV
jgi:hypothetical protein